MAKGDRRLKIVRVFGGKRHETEISERRARELGITTKRSTRPSVAYLVEGVFAWHRTGQRIGTSCSRCGTTQRDLVLHRRAGCPHCYEVFDQTVDRLLRLHRTNATHPGRVPQRLARYRRMFVEREALLNRLTMAVQDEDFEVAADLRDQLHAISRDDGEA